MRRLFWLRRSGRRRDSRVERTVIGEKSRHPNEVPGRRSRASLCVRTQIFRKPPPIWSRKNELYKQASFLRSHTGIPHTHEQTRRTSLRKGMEPRTLGTDANIILCQVRVGSSLFWLTFASHIFTSNLRGDVTRWNSLQNSRNGMC